MPADVWGRLEDITTQLVDAHKELSFVLQDERRTKAKSFVSQASDVGPTMRDRVASYEALEATCSRHELEGRINALKEEQHLLSLLVAHGDRSVQA